MEDRFATFFVDEVDPTVREFLSDFGSARRARLAAVMLVHTADHFWHRREAEREGTGTEEGFRALLADRCESFRLLADVANAAKHAVLRPRGKGKPPTLISGAHQVTARSLGWGEATWDEGRWDGPIQVVASLDDGSLHVLEGAVRECHAMWSLRLGAALPPLPE